MKLILEYSFDGGEPCGGYYQIMPFEYESEEAALIHFEEALDKAIADRNKRFHVLDAVFDTEEFYYYVEQAGYTKDLPHISTLEKWFERNRGKFADVD